MANARLKTSLSNINELRALIARRLVDFDVAELIGKNFRLADHALDRTLRDPAAELGSKPGRERRILVLRRDDREARHVVRRDDDVASFDSATARCRNWRDLSCARLKSAAVSGLSPISI